MTRVVIYSAHAFERPFLEAALPAEMEFIYRNETLSAGTAGLSAGCDGVAVFTSDQVNEPALQALKKCGARFVVTRSAGYDHIDLAAAHRLGIRVANVPGYSPSSVAEHAVALMLALSRKLILSDRQVKAHNFSLDHLVGMNLEGKTVGVIGTGKIGARLIRILHGFGCRLLAFDVMENPSLVSDFGVQYCALDPLCAQSDIITLHTPLKKETTYLLHAGNIAKMKEGVMLINTARGKVVNTRDVLEGLRSGRIGSFGMDVYEHEKGIFFEDLSEKKLEDPLLSELIQLPQVLITPHQAFLTDTSLKNIAQITADNIRWFTAGEVNANELFPG